MSWCFLALCLLFVLPAQTSPPHCAVLVCGNGTECAERFNSVWLSATQDEATRVYHTLNGGFLAPECTKNPHDSTVQRVNAIAFPLKTLICIDPHKLPTECAFKMCDYQNHTELFGDDECDEEEEKEKKKSKSLHKRSDLDQESCRKASSWLEIAIEKLAIALDLQERGEFANSTSFACVAELLFSRIARRIDQLYDDKELVFINDFARRRQHYQHLNSTGQNALFDVGANNVVVQLRAVQSIRTCRGELPLGGDNETRPITSIELYAIFDGNSTVSNVTQLTWAVAGTLPTFDVTVSSVDPNNLCAREQAPSDQELFDPARRFPELGGQDWAVVLGDGAPRRYLNLLAAATCPLLVLLENLRSNQSATSVTQLNMRRPIDSVSPAALNALIDPAIFLRVANGDLCTDIPALIVANGTNTTTTAAARGGAVKVQLLARPLGGIPLTLAPYASQCVGGDRAGESCTEETECGAGLACRRKPFAPRNIAFCYDGTDWDETRPCAFADADDQCPYGECVGAANGVDGGAYPFLYFFKTNECGTSNENPYTCNEPRVAEWHNYPNENAFSL